MRNSRNHTIHYLGEHCDPPPAPSSIHILPNAPQAISQNIEAVRGVLPWNHAVANQLPSLDLPQIGNKLTKLALWIHDHIRIAITTSPRNMTQAHVVSFRHSVKVSEIPSFKLLTRNANQNWPVVRLGNLEYLSFDFSAVTTISIANDDESGVSWPAPQKRGKLCLQITYAAMFDNSQIQLRKHVGQDFWDNPFNHFRRRALLREDDHHRLLASGMRPISHKLPSLFPSRYSATTIGI